MLLQRQLFRAVGGIPHADGLVVADRGEPAAVRAVGQAPHRAGVSLQRMHGFARHQVPNDGRAVGRAAGEMFTVGAEGQAQHPLVVAGQHRLLRAGRIGQ